MRKLLLLPVLLLPAFPAWADGSFFTNNSNVSASGGASANIPSNSTAGQAEYNALKSLITGNIGLGVAILCAACGCYLWLVAQKAGPGLTLIIIGASIALLPNMMDMMHANLCPLISDLGGTCASQSFVNGQ